MLNNVCHKCSFKRWCEMKKPNHRCKLNFVHTTTKGFANKCSNNIATEQQRIQSSHSDYVYAGGTDSLAHVNSRIQQSHCLIPPSFSILSPLVTARMCRASFTRSSLCLLARSIFWVSLHWMGWSCHQHAQQWLTFPVVLNCRPFCVPSASVPVVRWSCQWDDLIPVAQWWCSFEHLAHIPWWLSGQKWACIITGHFHFIPPFEAALVARYKSGLHFKPPFVILL